MDDIVTASSFSSSSSFSSVSPVGSPPEKCQVCLQKGHGYHFGAFTCRACAAFFRRCHFSSNPERKCRLFIDRCEPHPKNGRWFCKKCRLDRCFALGMTTTNIQYHRDAFKSSLTFVQNQSVAKSLGDRIGVPMTVESVVGAPHLVSFHRKDFLEKKAFPYIDMTKLVEKATRELISPSLSRRTRKMSNLEQLARGLEEHQSEQNESLSEAPMITRTDQLSEWEITMRGVAKWLTCSDWVRNLDDELKTDMLRTIWLVWGRIERIAMTAKMRVNRLCGKKQFVISHKYLVDYERMSSDISWWSPYTFEELGFFFVPREVFYDDLVWEMVDVQPDTVELTFLLCVISFQATAKRLQNIRVHEKMESLQEILSNDLHDYYIQKKQTMYAIRMKQLMRISERFLKLWFQRGEKYAVGVCFDMFQMRFSHPEFFEVFC